MQSSFPFIISYCGKILHQLDFKPKQTLKQNKILSNIRFNGTEETDIEFGTIFLATDDDFEQLYLNEFEF